MNGTSGWDFDSGASAGFVGSAAAVQGHVHGKILFVAEPVPPAAVTLAPGGASSTLGAAATVLSGRFFDSSLPRRLAHRCNTSG